MILKSLTLENIRSYTNTDDPIKFPLGITLFEGDMRAGKSTILYSIEFALFGLGEFKGTFLLRNGSRRGNVTLTFEEGGQEYIVHRSLVRKGKGVQQEECYIEGPLGKQTLAPTDLKEKILQILGFNEPPNPRAQSVIYRYAIFTPQEEMKEIVKKDPDARLQTLRKAFRIEDYKIALQNSGLLSSRINKNVIYLGATTQDIQTVRGALERTIWEQDKLRKNLKPLEEKESELLGDRTSLEQEKSELDKERERLNKIEATIPMLTKQIAEKDEDIDNNNKEICEIDRKIGKINSQIVDLEKVSNPTDLSLEKLELKKRDFEKKIEEQRKLKETAASATTQIPLLKKALQKAYKTHKDAKEELLRKEKKVKEELQPQFAELEKVVKPTTKTLIQLKHERSELEHRQKKIDSQISKIEERISNFASLIDDKKCPICERSIDTKDFSSKRSHLNAEYKLLKASSKSVTEDVEVTDALIANLTSFNEADKELGKLRPALINLKEAIEALRKSSHDAEEEEQGLKDQIEGTEEEAAKKKVIQERINALEHERDGVTKLSDALKKYQQAQKDLLKQLSEQIDANASLKRYKGLVEKLEGEKRKLEEARKGAEREIKPISSIIAQLNVLTSRVKNIEHDTKEVRDNISSTKTSLQLHDERKFQLEAEVKSKEKKIEKMSMLSEYRVWLEEYFSPAVDNIEKHVMESLRRRFNDQFQRWFGILVDDPSLQVNANEDFTPQIERDGFDQDYVQLSGGERTSVALAYRLALNTLVQGVSAGGASNLLILDEPTDGFSKEQLFKLRDVLEEIKCPQIIMVSHERELEGFADNIIRIENSHGISQIRASQKD